MLLTSYARRECRGARLSIRRGGRGRGRMLSFSRMSDLTLYLYAFYKSNALSRSHLLHALSGAFCSTVAAVVRALRASLNERLLAKARGMAGATALPKWFVLWSWYVIARRAFLQGLLQQ